MKRILAHIDLKWRLFGLLLLLSFLYGYWQHFLDPIQPIHECRKADSLSQAMQFMKGGNLLQPKTHSISNFGRQEAAAEFPIIYYVVGQIWRLVGFHLWIAKLFSLGYLFAALISFRKVLLWYFNSERITIIFSGIIFSSPVLIYYADTLLPDVFSFASLLLSASYFYRYVQTRKLSYWLVFTFFLAIAILIKITALVAVLSYVGAFFFYSLHQPNRAHWQDRRTWMGYLALFLVLVLTFWWYRYAIAYNNKHHAHIFSTTIRPIWEVDAVDRWRIIRLICQEHLKEVMHPILFVGLLLVIGAFAIKGKISLFFRYWIPVAFVGLAAYFILWFWVFEVHDYYFIEVLFFPLTIVALIFQNARTYLQTQSIGKWILATGLTYIFLNTVSFTQVAAGNQNSIVKETFLTSKILKDIWSWFYFNHQEGLQQIQEQSTEIQRVIKSSDTVFCFSDPYPNVHLSTIDRVGFSGYGYRSYISNSAMIRRWIGMGASKLLLLQADTANPLIKPYLTHQLYHQNKVFIYDLRPFRK
ncbi:MAG: glycosyltransferase family 39 protein [Crocinitomicaceae bacterium]|nr:glycosyltransferase family 39 protein [Crocinitomicaceae bacterium]